MSVPHTDRTLYLTKDSVDLNWEKYKEFLRATEREGIEGLIEYLENETDMKTAPASSKFHGNYEGGLIHHSLNVLEILVRKVKMFKLEVSNDTLVIISLLHDLCKTNFYIKDSAFYKPDGRNWETYSFYKIDDSLPLGHGQKSAMIAQRYVKLTDIELLAITWHMGMFEECNKMSLANASDYTPLVTLLQTSDMEASRMLEKVIDLRGGY